MVPHNTSRNVLIAQRCKPCTKIGKNLKPVITKNTHAEPKTLTEPNQELRLDFTGPITDNFRDIYILVSIDKYSRYPQAKAYQYCDTETALNYLKSYIKFHGLPRTISCDQAHAFKSRNFEIFCNDNNIKLILAPVRDLRGTGLVERMIQTLKRRFSVLSIDPLWGKRNTRRQNCTHYRKHKTKHHHTHHSIWSAFRQTAQRRELKNILTKRSSNNLNYDKV